MIPQIAVKQYLSRPLESHAWLKELDADELWDAIYKLDPRPKLNECLLTHQLVCFLLGVAYPQFAYWLDMGSGKTLVTLELLRYRMMQLQQFPRSLIFITSDKAFPTWEKQIKRFKINLPYTLLEGSSAHKWEALQEFGNGLVFISYPGAVSLVTRAVQKKRKVEWMLDHAKVDQLGQDAGAIIMDESTKASGYKSLTFAMLERLCEQTPVHYGLAGRPFGRDPTLLWAQHYLIDGGETLGTTLGMFREAFFTSEQNIYAARRVPKYRQKYMLTYKFDKRKTAALSKMIQHRSITYAAEECIDLPACLPVIEEVRFPKETLSYYRRAVESLIAAKGNLQVVENVFLRMRQLSSGFLGFKDDETGDRAQVEFAENPKFDRLMELLGELPQDRKAVVFYEFTHSGRKIQKAVREELGIDNIWLWSGTKNYKQELRRFEEDPDCGVAVVNNRLGAFSLDGLQVANYSFFYESPVSPIDREQAERRTLRQGQRFKVFRYDVIVHGSADQKILDFHKEGESLTRGLLRDPSMLKA